MSDARTLTVTQPNLFDYQALDAETRIVVQQRTSEIRALMKRAAQDILDIGQKLIEVKARLGHGRFGAWLAAEFDWSQDTANNFIRVAQKFSDIPKFSEFAPSALYLLAAPSTPESARQEALERAGAGEAVTYSTARAITEEHKQFGPRAVEGAGAPIPVDRPAYQERRAEREQVRHADTAARIADVATVPLAARWHLHTAPVAQAGAVLGAASVDVILTDPPYPEEYLPVYAELAAVAAQVLKPGGSCFVMIGQSYLPQILAAMTPYLRYQWTLSYLTPGGQAVQLWQRKVNTFWKPVLWFVKGDYSGPWLGDVARSRPNDNDKRFHDWGQSESGMADLMERCTRPGDWVLDPFVGGGTTGVVALSMQRRFIGLDSDPAAVAQTRARILALSDEALYDQSA